MAFYMSTNGILHPFSFEYLKGNIKGPRLEKTLIHGEIPNPETKAEKIKQIDFYAINIMTSPVESVNPETLLKDIKELMQKKGIRHIPITHHGKIMGIVSDRDILKIDMSGTFYFLKAKNIMSSVLIITDEESSLENIASVLIEEKISCLPVIDKNQKLIGIISRTDILKVMIKNRLVMF